MGRTHDVVVIGGGAVGSSVAVHLRRTLDRVLLLEREPELLGRASYINQARVHNGYHYPRSVLTALRSRVNFPRFAEDYADCVDRTFAQYYAVARQYSKVTAEQFGTFCRRIGAPAEPAPAEVRRLFEARLVEDVFLVEEFAFDAARLRARLLAELQAADVEVETGAWARRLEPEAGGDIAVVYERDGAARRATAGHVFNCTYSGINEVLVGSGLEPIPLKHELTELALVEPPAPLREAGVTVMCGPFFSVMPFPSRGLHSFSHVRYTPHQAWHDRPGEPWVDGHGLRLAREPRSNYPLMVRDAARYMPVLAGCRHVESLFETKTVLPSSEADDSRPILFKHGHGLPNLTCIMGGKIDNIYDVLAELEELRGAGALR